MVKSLIWAEDSSLVSPETGKQLSSSDVLYLRNFRLGGPADWAPQTSEKDILVLDAPSIRMAPTYPDGTKQKS